MSSKKQRTREKILDAARRLLAERGYNGVGMDEVAREAGITRRTVYLHFESKSALLVAMAQRLDQVVGTPKIIQPSHEAGSALESLERFVAAYGTIEPQIYDIASIIYSARRSDGAAEAAWQDRMKFRRDIIKEIMKRLKKERLLAEGWTVDQAADFVWALLSMHMYEYLAIERKWPVERLVARLQSILKGVLVENPESPG